MLDDDQGVNASQEHGVHVDEIGREDATGLCGQELLPGRPAAAGRGSGPGVQDLLHRGGRDVVPKLTSSPCTRRCPTPDCPVRCASVRIAAAVGTSRCAAADNISFPRASACPMKATIKVALSLSADATAAFTAATISAGLRSRKSRGR